MFIFKQRNLINFTYLGTDCWINQHTLHKSAYQLFSSKRKYNNHQMLEAYNYWLSISIDHILKKFCISENEIYFL